jgi:GT2 family glycosyltransferase
VSNAPSASIVIPTLAAPGYLEVTVASVMPQAVAEHAEVIVVSDGRDPATAAVAERHGARLVSLEEQRGLNAARNAGVAAARSDFIVFIDQDIDAPPGWLDALLDGARSNPDCEVFGGPIHARLEGGGPRACGREPPPITTLDLGPEDRNAELVWGANMAIRRSALERVGMFDEELHGRGNEDDWEYRYAARGGRIRYLAKAGLDHRRTGEDARLWALARAAYAQGREARRSDVRLGKPRPAFAELRTLAGCAWHTFRRRCAYGIVMGARAAGSLHEALSPRRVTERDDFLSGTSGQVFGIRATSKAVVGDALLDAVAVAQLQRWRLQRAARKPPRRRILALAVERAGEPNLLLETRDELLRSRHEVHFASTAAGSRGKWGNLNALLADNPPDGHDWVVIVDDDVWLPRGFLDTFLFLVERFELRLAQPAHRRRSHAAWQVTRRRAGSVVRETAFVEIGPLVAFHQVVFDLLLPFPELRAAWGLDAYWSAMAREQGWKIGIVDATPIRHGLRRIAASYDRKEAIAEGRRFLAGKSYVNSSEAQRTLVSHRTWS